jgi:hypothetical protein
MPRAIQGLPAHVRLKSLAMLGAAAFLLSQHTVADANSLFEPGTTTYAGTLRSTDPIQIGPNHTLILNTDDFGFQLFAPLVNEGVVKLAASPDNFGFVPVNAPLQQVNRGRWIIDNGLYFLVRDGLDNRGGILEMAANSHVSSSSTLTGGLIQGAGSSVSAKKLSDVAFAGQVTVTHSTIERQLHVMPGGTLALQGELQVRDPVTLSGTGQSVLKPETTVSGLAGGTAPQALIIDRGHTLAASGQVKNVYLINNGTVKVDKQETLESNTSVTQQGVDSEMIIDGSLAAPSIQLSGGRTTVTGTLQGNIVVDGGHLTLGAASEIKGLIDVQSGRLTTTDRGWYTDGDLQLSDQSEFEVVVTHGGWVRTDIWNSIKLGGDLILTFAEGAQIPSHVLLDMMTFSGTFRSVRVNGAGDTPWVIRRQDGESGIILLTPIPEPGTWALMLIGLGVLAGVQGRRPLRIRH